MDVSLPTETGRDATENRRMPEIVRSVGVVAIGASMMIGMAYGAMLLLTSPDGWVMKAANQAVTTAQHGTLASYDIDQVR